MLRPQSSLSMNEQHSPFQATLHGGPKNGNPGHPGAHTSPVFYAPDSQQANHQNPHQTQQHMTLNGPSPSQPGRAPSSAHTTPGSATVPPPLADSRDSLQIQMMHRQQTGQMPIQSDPHRPQGMQLNPPPGVNQQHGLQYPNQGRPHSMMQRGIPVSLLPVTLSTSLTHIFVYLIVENSNLPRLV